MKHLLLFFVLLFSLPSFAQDHPFGDPLERQKEKRTKMMATQQPTDTAKAVAVPAMAKTAAPASNPIKQATTAKHTPVSAPATPAVRSAARIKPVATPTAVAKAAPNPTPASVPATPIKAAPTPAAVTTTVPDPTPAVTTKPKHTAAPPEKVASARHVKRIAPAEPAPTGTLVLIGQISQAHTSREVIMLAPRLISQDANCDVSSYSFHISNAKGQTWGPMAAQGAEFTYQMMDKIKEWDGPCTISIDNIKLKCAGQETAGRSVTLTYDR